MSNLIYAVAALCLLGFAFGAALVYVALRDAEYGVATFGVVIFVVSLFGFCFLDEPIMDVQNELAGSDTEYKAVYKDEIKSFVDCYKENGYNVCETKDGKEMVVGHYWKKGKTQKKEGKQALKYKGIKDSEIKKYTSCEDDGDSKVCTAEDGTKEKVEAYWKMGGKDGNEKD